MLALLAFDGHRWLKSQASPRAPALLYQIAQPMRCPEDGDRFVQGLQHGAFLALWYVTLLHDVPRALDDCCESLLRMRQLAYLEEPSVGNVLDRGSKDVRVGATAAVVKAQVSSVIQSSE